MNDGTQELPEASRDTLIRLAREWREGWQGKVTIKVGEGGTVQWVAQEVTLKPEDLRDEHS